MNLMALPLMLGTGVDYTLFIQLALRRHGGDLVAVRRSVGRALMLCGGTAVAGFGSLALSSNLGMASLGQVCAVGIGANALIAIFLLPAWWRLFAAKAESEADANAMIADIESQIHDRIGNAVFGADEDRLEEVVLNLVTQRGWTLVAVESGLDGLLARKIPHVASFAELTAASLMDALRAARAESKADAALGVTVHMEDHSADMALITPRGEKTHRITYGGPPRSLPRWAMNLALNWLRTVAQESD